MAALYSTFYSVSGSRSGDEELLDTDSEDEEDLSSIDEFRVTNANDIAGCYGLSSNDLVDSAAFMGSSSDSGSSSEDLSFSKALEDSENETGGYGQVSDLLSDTSDDDLSPKKSEASNSIVGYGVPGEDSSENEIGGYGNASACSSEHDSPPPTKKARKLKTKTLAGSGADQMGGYATQNEIGGYGDANEIGGYGEPTTDEESNTIGGYGEANELGGYGEANENSSDQETQNINEIGGYGNANEIGGYGDANEIGGYGTANELGYAAPKKAEDVRPRSLSKPKQPRSVADRKGAFHTLVNLRERQEEMIRQRNLNKRHLLKELKRSYKNKNVTGTQNFKMLLIWTRVVLSGLYWLSWLTISFIVQKHMERSLLQSTICKKNRKQSKASMLVVWLVVRSIFAPISSSSLL